MSDKESHVAITKHKEPSPSKSKSIHFQGLPPLVAKKPPSSTDCDGRDIEYPSTRYIEPPIKSLEKRSKASSDTLNVPSLKEYAKDHKPNTKNGSLTDMEPAKGRDLEPITYEPRPHDPNNKAPLDCPCRNTTAPTNPNSKCPSVACKDPPEKEKEKEKMTVEFASEHGDQEQEPKPVVVNDEMNVTVPQSVTNATPAGDEQPPASDTTQEEPKDEPPVKSKPSNYPNFSTGDYTTMSSQEDRIHPCMFTSDKVNVPRPFICPVSCIDRMPYIGCMPPTSNTKGTKGQAGRPSSQPPSAPGTPPPEPEMGGHDTKKEKRVPGRYISKWEVVKPYYPMFELEDHVSVRKEGQGSTTDRQSQPSSKKQKKEEGGGGAGGGGAPGHQGAVHAPQEVLRHQVPPAEQAYRGRSSGKGC